MVFSVLIGVSLVFTVIFELKTRRLRNKSEDEIYDDLQRWLKMKPKSSADDPAQALKVVKQARVAAAFGCVWAGAGCAFIIASTYLIGDFFDISVVFLALAAVAFNVQIARYSWVKFSAFEQLINAGYKTGEFKAPQAPLTEKRPDNLIDLTVASFASSPPSQHVGFVLLCVLMLIFQIVVGSFGIGLASKTVPWLLAAGVLGQMYLIFRQRQAGEEDWVKRFKQTRATHTFLGKVDFSKARTNPRLSSVFYLIALFPVVFLLMLWPLTRPLIMENFTIVAVDFTLGMLAMLGALNLVVFDFKKMCELEASSI